MTADPISISFLALQHADSQFPSGGFAFSQGLEASAQLAQDLGGFSLEEFLEVQIKHRWACSDRIALVRAHRASGDLQEVAGIDQELEASTFIERIRTGSKRNGIALLTTHRRIGTAGAEEYLMNLRQGGALGHLPVVQGFLWASLGLSERTAETISGYQAAASITAAAVRLGLIGAIEAQALNSRLWSFLADILAQRILGDEALRSFIPLAEIASARHGAEGQRLFSN